MAKARRSKSNARNSWTRTLLGLLIAASAGVVGLVLLRDHLHTRPLQLQPATETLATRFEQALTDAMVPSSAIRLGSRRTESTADAVWNIYHYDVEIPATLTLDRIGNLLRDTLRDTSATVHDVQQGPNEVSLSLYLAGHEFLIARLHTSSPKTVAAPRPAPRRASEAAPPTAPATTAAAQEPDPERSFASLLPWSWWPEGWGRSDAPMAPVSPRLAIILDDGGYGGPATEAVLALDPRLTLAILPYTPKAAETAQRGAELGFQIMLHMPMESHSAGELFQGSLLTTMNASDIERLIQNAINQVPHVAGVNNHTGSKFSENHDSVTAMLEALRRRGLFFIDSRTIHTTVALATACELGVPAAERDVFLDHENTRESIEAQWNALIATCREQGRAIGIGHFRELTADILAEKLPQLDDYGIELVHAGALAQCE